MLAWQDEQLRLATVCNSEMAEGKDAIPITELVNNWFAR